MAIYRIKVSLPDGRLSFTGLFNDSAEATRQVLADYPAARGLTVIFIKRQEA